jgi:hypothetical protein
MYSIRNSEGIGCEVINEEMREYLVNSQLGIYEEPLVTYELEPDPFDIYFNRLLCYNIFSCVPDP